jgi:nicotinamidase-related amidase
MAADTVLAGRSAPYLAFVEAWLADLQDLACEARHSAVLVVDVIGGFCAHGPLASPRVAAMVPPLASLLDAYARAGGTTVFLAEDAHAPDAREFTAFPPHCLAGSDEARTMPEVAARVQPTWRRFPKQSTNALAEPAVRAAIDEALGAGIRDVVVAGDCTDLCIYQAAMSLQVQLNRADHAAFREARIIVPERVVQTYDLPVESAATLGAQPHPGDLLHAVFLHHMALNGVHVVRDVTWT